MLEKDDARHIAYWVCNVVPFIVFCGVGHGVMAIDVEVITNYLALSPIYLDLGFLNPRPFLFFRYPCPHYLYVAMCYINCKT